MALPELKEFCRPQSAAELSGVFKTYEDGALFVAGGTFVHGLEARGLLSGVQALVRDLNRAYRRERALHERDCEAEGFRWIAVDDRDNSVFAWLSQRGMASTVMTVN